MKTGLVVAVIVAVLAGYATLAYQKRGEVVQRTSGTVARCERLGGAVATRFHATIRADGGQYVIAELPDCAVGERVEIQVRRGALFFNTVFTAGQG